MGLGRRVGAHLEIQTGVMPLTQANAGRAKAARSAGHLKTGVQREPEVQARAVAGAYFSLQQCRALVLECPVALATPWCASS